MNDGGASGSVENKKNQRVLVTGASGFLGSHVVEACIKDGLTVRIFHRSYSDLSAFENLSIEKARGEITDQIALKEALEGCQGVFHVAGMVSFNPADRDTLIKTNVYGTRAVMLAALEHRVERVVYTSTSGVLPGTRFAELSDDESAIYNPRDQCAYYESKHLAEVEVFRAAAQGMHAVIVNPSQVNGPGNARLKPLFLSDNALIFEGGLNHVDVRDVAAGHVAAYHKGRAGERYILGHAEGNLSMIEFFDLVEQIRGKRLRRIKVDKKFLYKALLRVEKLQQKLSNKSLPISISSDLLLAMKRYRFVNPSKAIKELDLPQRPVRETFRDTIAWLEQNT